MTRIAWIRFVIFRLHAFQKMACSRGCSISIEVCEQPRELILESEYLAFSYFKIYLTELQNPGELCSYVVTYLLNSRLRASIRTFTQRALIESLSTDVFEPQNVNRKSKFLLFDAYYSFLLKMLSREC